MLAFVIAPFAIPFVFLFTFLLPGSAVYQPATGSIFERLAGVITWSVLFSIYALPIAYVSELVLGIAVWKAFKHYGIRSPFAFVIAGAVMGWLVFTVVMRQGYLMEVSNPWFWICITAGTSSALLFRVVVFSGRQETPVLS